MSAPTILFVDDEAGVLRAVTRLFRKSGFDVLTASDASAGFELLESHEVGVVFSDQRMPGMRGTDFLKQVRERYPDTVRCIMSGYAEMESVVAAINDGNVYRFVAKPWDDDALISVVRQCLERAQEIANKKATVVALERKACDLEAQYGQQEVQLQLQKALLNSSRDVLERLPVAVAALDADDRFVYANRRFAHAFGHLPGSGLGQIAAPTWRQAAERAPSGPVEVTVDDAPYAAHVVRVEIAGQAHTLIATVAA